MLAYHRFHIPTPPAPPPESGYPAQFHLDDPQAYVKYGHVAFMGSSQSGDPHWTPEIITQTWYQAEHGHIPISGAGYGGKFAGEGFEGIWLDISEIVRPTRDGIHGREVISTQVDLGGRLPNLAFDAAGRLVSRLPASLSLPIPVIFNPLPDPLPGRGGLLAFLRAASNLGTVALIDPGELAQDVEAYQPAMGFRLTGNPLETVPVDTVPRYVEVELENLNAVPA